MKRSKKIKPVASHARQLEEEAARSFAQAQQVVVDFESQLQQLLDYRQDYLSRWSDVSQTRANILQLRDYQMFLEKLKSGITQATQMVEQSKQQCESVRQQWLIKRARCQALDKVLENHLHKEQQLVDKLEQQEMEELSLRLYLQH